MNRQLLFISIFLNISPAFHRDLNPLEYYGIDQCSATHRPPFQFVREFCVNQLCTVMHSDAN